MTASFHPTARHMAWPLLIAALALLLFSHPFIHGDGTASLMYLDSLAGDGDLRLENQAVAFAQVSRYHLFTHAVTGRLITSFPFGNAVLLIPFYWLGRALDTLPALHAQDAYFTSVRAWARPMASLRCLGPRSTPCWVSAAPPGLRAA